MRIEAHRYLDFNAALEREAMDQIADAIAPLFDIEVPRERIGLIVVSDNAGTATSVYFWSEAIRTGVGVASPELFPWCLANAPCGALARRFVITGPNSTLLGEADALRVALETCEDLSSQGRIDTAIVVAASFATADQAGHAIALRLHSTDECLMAMDQIPGTPSLRAAIPALGQLLDTQEDLATPNN